MLEGSSTKSAVRTKTDIAHYLSRLTVYEQDIFWLQVGVNQSQIVQDYGKKKDARVSTWAIQNQRRYAQATDLSSCLAKCWICEPGKGV